MKPIYLSLLLKTAGEKNSKSSASKSYSIDGLFDVSLAKDLTKWQIIKNLGNLYSGKIVKHKLVETFKTTNLEVLDVANSLPIIQADGELIGKGTFQVKIIPKAISFFC